jgi:hypothetical protein
VASIYEGLEALDDRDRQDYGQALANIARDRLDRVWEEVKAVLDAAPPRLDAIRELMVEPTRAYRRSIEVLSTVLDDPRSAEHWIHGSFTLALCMEVAEQFEEAIRHYDDLLAQHEQGRVPLERVRRVRSLVSRAMSQHRLGRAADARANLERAKELVEQEDAAEMREVLQEEIASAEEEIAAYSA